MILLGVDQISDAPPEVFGQASRVRAHDDLLIRVFT